MQACTPSQDLKAFATRALVVAFLVVVALPRLATLSAGRIITGMLCAAASCHGSRMPTRAVVLWLALGQAAATNPCTSEGEMTHNGLTMRCVSADDALYDVYQVSGGTQTCGAT